MNPMGTKIRAARYRHRLSSTELAHLVGITQGHLSRIERGLVDSPSPQLIQRLEETLGIPLKDFETAPRDYTNDKIVAAIAHLLEALSITEGDRNHILATIHRSLENTDRS